MKPASAPNLLRTSSASAGRNGAPSVFWSLISLRRWSPRITTRTGPRSSTITGNALMMAPRGTPSASQTASTVEAPGVSTSRGSGEASGSPSTGWAVALAISTFAA